MRGDVSDGGHYDVEGDPGPVCRRCAVLHANAARRIRRGAGHSAFAVAVALLGGLAPAEVLRDPLLAAGAPVEHFHLGLFSNLGVVAWTVAGSICLFTAIGETARLHPRAREFLAYAGIFSLVVMFDDLYMIHENLVNVPLSAVYVVAGAFYAYRYFAVFVHLDLIILIMSIALLGSSMIIDEIVAVINSYGRFSDEKNMIRGQVDEMVAPMNRRNLLYLLEDGPKFLGICAWATFHVRAAYLLRRA
jgi:hypothetical protein